MRRDDDDELAADTESVVEFDTFDEALAHLMSEMEPGSSISLHEEHCALAVDEAECTCTPWNLTSGAQA
jgi:hypothetical protein